ncbi:MAG: rRNA maturation RNase YbeY [Candidatus Liptonbacteria bacterium]
MFVGGKTPKTCEPEVRGILNFLVSRKIISAKLHKARVGVHFLGNMELRRLKKACLGRDAEVVDVLSFPEKKGFPDPENKGVFLGEILINKSIAARYPTRVHYLLLHGLLHLLGYDHIRKSDNIKMQEMERLVLLKMGWSEE